MSAARFDYNKKFFNIKENDYFKIFALASIVAIAIFLPFAIYDKGVFMQYGDYNVQQIPFYALANQAVKDGNIWWSFNTDLGANFIGSYSFYLLGSPFFWLTIPFPSSVVPYLMAPLFVLKFATAAVTSYAYIKRFIKTREYAMIGAMLYAFSSFQVYNVFFNHFNDVTAFFPLLLIGLEELIVNNRKGVFALAAALMCTINYFFFFGQIIFVIIYFFLRSMHNDFLPGLKKFIQLLTEAVLGLALASFLLLPSILAILQNSRLDSSLSGFNMLFYNSIQRYGLIFQSIFFPHDIAAKPNLFADSNSKWASVAAWLPLFGATAVISFITQNKRHWMRRILILSMVMAFIPFFNSFFFAMNSGYYARWFYMPLLIMALVTAYVFENKKYNMNKGIVWSAVILGSFVVAGLLPVNKNGNIEWFKFPSYVDRYWTIIIISAVSLFATYFIVNKFKYSRKKFFLTAMPATCIVIVVYSVFSLGWGRSYSYSYEQVVEKGVYGSENFNLPDDEFYRVDIYNGMDNWGMMWKMPTIQAFQSVVPVSVMEFYKSIGIERSVGSRPPIDYIHLRTLTSVRYLMAERKEKQNAENLNFDGFKFIGYQNGFTVFENENFVPMGFTYNYYCNDADFNGYEEKKKDALLLKAMYLSSEDQRKYSRYLKRLPQNTLYETGRDELGESDYQDNDARALAIDADNRRKESCYEFITDNRGFNASINLSRDNLVFFSVPHDEGWKATVNGEDVEIVKVNKGFMAVLCQKGENQIRFTYTTPGLYIGLLITGGAIILFILYLFIIKHLAKSDPLTFALYAGHHRHFINNISQPDVVREIIDADFKRADVLIESEHITVKQPEGLVAYLEPVSVPKTQENCEIAPETLIQEQSPGDRTIQTETEAGEWEDKFE